MARRRLSKQQKARIARIHDRRRERATTAAESVLSGAGETEQHTGRVVVRHGRSLMIRGEDGNQIHGMFRANLGEVVCGDRVVWQAAPNNEGVVVAVLPREAALSRPGLSLIHI